MALTLGVVTTVTQANASVFGNWCGRGDEALYLGQDEAILGEHAYCRWNPVPGAGGNYTGILLCRTSETLRGDTVERPVPVSLKIETSGDLTMDFLDGDAPEIWKRCL